MLAAWAGTSSCAGSDRGRLDNRWWPLLLVTLLYLIVAAIPYLGGSALVAGLLGLAHGLCGVTCATR
jgi:hypothetical protein